jgi:hypothetical protein
MFLEHAACIFSTGIIEADDENVAVAAMPARGSGGANDSD